MQYQFEKVLFNEKNGKNAKKVLDNQRMMC